jgi:hypothetical protein
MYDDAKSFIRHCNQY